MKELAETTLRITLAPLDNWSDGQCVVYFDVKKRRTIKAARRLGRGICLSCELYTSAA